jgi:hypothetical protein
MADHVLAEQMKAMERGDRYYVISDLASWLHSQLEKFQEETAKAVGRGVIVRRIFNLLRPSWHEAAGHELAVEEILKFHFDASNEWQSESGGKYEIRVMDEEVLTNRQLQKFDQGKIRESHFGVFLHGREGTAVRFKVPTPSLSEMLLCRDQNMIEKDVVLFEAAWNASPSLTERHGLLKTHPD